MMMKRKRILEHILNLPYDTTKWEEQVQLRYIILVGEYNTDISGRLDNEIKNDTLRNILFEKNIMFKIIFFVNIYQNYLIILI